MENFINNFITTIKFLGILLLASLIGATVGCIFTGFPFISRENFDFLNFAWGFIAGLVAMLLTIAAHYKD